MERNATGDKTGDYIVILLWGLTEVPMFCRYGSISSQ